MLEANEKKRELINFWGSFLFFCPQLPLALFFLLPENLMKKKKVKSQRKTDMLQTNKSRLGACLQQKFQPFSHIVNLIGML